MRLVCKITNNSGYGKIDAAFRLIFCAKKIRPGIVPAGTWCRIECPVCAGVCGLEARGVIRGADVSKCAEIEFECQGGVYLECIGNFVERIVVFSDGIIYLAIVGI